MTDIIDVLLIETVPLWLFVLLNILSILICLECYLKERNKS